MKKFSAISVIFIFAILSSFLFGQNNDRNIDREFYNAEKLFFQKKYNFAREAFLCIANTPQHKAPAAQPPTRSPFSTSGNTAPSKPVATNFDSFHIIITKIAKNFSKVSCYFLKQLL